MEKFLRNVSVNFYRFILEILPICGLKSLVHKHVKQKERNFAVLL